MMERNGGASLSGLGVSGSSPTRSLRSLLAAVRRATTTIKAKGAHGTAEDIKSGLDLVLTGPDLLPKAIGGRTLAKEPLARAEEIT